MTKSPRVLSTRITSRKTRGVSIYPSVSGRMTTSKAAAQNGRKWASAWSTCLIPRRLATFNISYTTSTPTTVCPARRSTRSSSPVPHPRVSTVCFSGSRAASHVRRAEDSPVKVKCPLRSHPRFATRWKKLASARTLSRWNICVRKQPPSFLALELPSGANSHTYRSEPQLFCAR